MSKHTATAECNISEDGKTVDIQIKSLTGKSLTMGDMVAGLKRIVLALNSQSEDDEETLDNMPSNLIN